MTQCKIYRCRKRPGNPCCAECDAPCILRCANSPERCGCSQQHQPTRQTRRQTYDHDAIYRLILKGLTYGQVAAQLGCSLTTVYSVAKGHGIHRRKGGKQARGDS